MKNDTLEKQTNRIADAIVELVERTDGPVTLVRVQREVPGFAGHEPPFWHHVITHASGETSYWGGMSEAGFAAFRKVTVGRMVAIQFVNIVPYLVDGVVSTDETWQPIVLLPARAANMDTPTGLIRYPQWFLEHMVRLAATGKSRSRQLTPHYVGATADQFFGIGTGEELPLPRRYPTAFDLISWPPQGRRESNLAGEVAQTSSGIGRA